MIAVVVVGWMLSQAPQATIATVDQAQERAAGKGVSERVLLDKPTPQSGETTLKLIALQPGATLPVESSNRDRVFFLLEGGVTVGQQAALRGAAIWVPSGVGTSLQAQQPTRILVATGGGGRRKVDPPLRIARADRSPALSIAGGKGEARILFDAAIAPAAGLSNSTLSFDPGAAVPEHAHAQEEEVLFMVEGTGELTVNGKTVTVRPGTALRIPAGARHAFKVTSATPVKAVQFYSPPGPEQRFKPKTQ